MNAQAGDWKARREEQRETEWELRDRVLRFVNTMLDRWEDDAEKFGTLEALSKQVELVSKLGRLATDQEDTTAAPSGISEEFLASLVRIQEGADARNNSEADDSSAGSATSQGSNTAEVA